MGLLGEQFIDEEAISPNLLCSICTAVFDDPVSAHGRPCHCTFCRQCITQWLSSHTSCPVDRNQMHIENFTPDIKVQNFVDELQVYCLLRHEGCFWTGRYDKRAAHQDECVAYKNRQLQTKVAHLSELLDQAIQTNRAFEREKDRLTHLAHVGEWLQMSMSAAPPVVKDFLGLVQESSSTGTSSSTDMLSISKGKPGGSEQRVKATRKNVIQEGVKRGVELSGAADMSGLMFFCTSVDMPSGDVDLLVESLKAMNAKSDPITGERKGDSGHIGKTILSAGPDQLAIVSYVPEDKQTELSCEEWIRATVQKFGGEVLTVSRGLCTARAKTNSHVSTFPLNIREPMILEANDYLRTMGLIPEDCEDDQEFIFGDDVSPA